MKLAPGVKVRYLFSPGEGEGGERRRATDPIWSLKIFDLSCSVVSAEQPVSYYLSGGSRRSFVREELQVVLIQNCHQHLCYNDNARERRYECHHCK